MKETSMKRTIALAIAIAVAAGLAVTSQARVGGHGGHGSGDIQLTYKKWAPNPPTMTGVVGGDIPGVFVGAVMEVTADTGGYLVDATYIDVATDPSRSFTARVHGREDTASASAVLDGRVVDGWLKGRRVHVEYKIVSCTESPDGICYEGTITIKRGGHQT
jgi:hypothetical protein